MNQTTAIWVIACVLSAAAGASIALQIRYFKRPVFVKVRLDPGAIERAPRPAEPERQFHPRHADIRRDLRGPERYTPAPASTLDPLPAPILSHPAMTDADWARLPDPLDSTAPALAYDTNGSHWGSGSGQPWDPAPPPPPTSAAAPAAPAPMPPGAGTAARCSACLRLAGIAVTAPCPSCPDYQGPGRSTDPTDPYANGAPWPGTTHQTYPAGGQV